MDEDEARATEARWAEVVRQWEARLARLPPGSNERQGLSAEIDDVRDRWRQVRTIVALWAQMGERERAVYAVNDRLRAEKAELRLRADLLGDTQGRIAAAWGRIGAHFLVSPSPANAERIANLACAAAEVRDEAIRTRDEAVAELQRLRAEHAAALATARREGAEEMRERAACAVEPAGWDGDEFDGYDRWDTADALAMRVRRLPLDAPGGAT